MSSPAVSPSSSSSYSFLKPKDFLIPPPNQRTDTLLDSLLPFPQEKEDEYLGARHSTKASVLPAEENDNQPGLLSPLENLRAEGHVEEKQLEGVSNNHGKNELRQEHKKDGRYFPLLEDPLRVKHSTEASAPPVEEKHAELQSLLKENFLKYKEEIEKELNDQGYQQVQVSFENDNYKDYSKKLLNWLKNCTYFRKTGDKSNVLNGPGVILKIIEDNSKPRLFLIRAANIINNIPVDIINIETNWNPNESFDLSPRAIIYPNTGKLLNLSYKIGGLPNLLSDDFLKNKKIIKYIKYISGEINIYFFEIENDIRNWKLKGFYDVSSYGKNMEAINKKIFAYISEGGKKGPPQSLIECKIISDSNFCFPIRKSGKDHPAAKFFDGLSGIIWHSPDEKKDNGFPYAVYLSKKELIDLKLFSCSQLILSSYCYFYNPYGSRAQIKAIIRPDNVKPYQVNIKFPYAGKEPSYFYNRNIRGSKALIPLKGEEMQNFNTGKGVEIIELLTEKLLSYSTVNLNGKIS